MIIKTYHNDPQDQTQRKFQVLQVMNNDFGGDENDPFQGQDVNFTTNWDDYLKLLQGGSEDDTQYVYMEAIDEYPVAEYANVLTGNSASSTKSLPPSSAAYATNAQAVYVILRNLDWVDPQFTNLGPNYQSLAIGSPNGASPQLPDADATPVRADPLQMIVNVSWGGLAVEFYPEDT
jgi:hypothetical protein